MDPQGSLKRSCKILVKILQGSLQDPYLLRIFEDPQGSCKILKDLTKIFTRVAVVKNRYFGGTV